MTDDFSEYYEAAEPGRRERAYAWATAIGLQDVDGLKPSKYLLATAKRNIEGEITHEQARQIVDAYYESKDAHDIPPETKEADQLQRAFGRCLRHALRLVHLGGLAETSVSRRKHADGCAVCDQVPSFAGISRFQ